MTATALKIALRDARASPAKFLFVVLAVAAGVGALTGVRGFSETFRAMLLRDARVLMAADLMVRAFQPPNPEQQRALDELVRQGARRTEILETVSMMSSSAVAEPLLVSLKAVDPRVYPFYGALRLEPAVPLLEALRPDTLAVSDDLLVRLRVAAGDSVRLGGQDFTVAAVVRAEPDRMTGSLNVGPRALLSREALDRSGLVQLGSRVSRRHLFRLPETGLDVAQARALLRAAYPEAMVADYRETHPLITRSLNRATRFLSLVSLVALMVGALGVAAAMHAHLRQKLDHVAVMKALGARSGQVLRIFLAQTLLLGLAGGLLGVALGVAVELAFPPLLARYFDIRPAFHFNPSTALQGLLIGLLTTLLFTWPPLLGVRRIRPYLVLRRDMAEARPGPRERWRRARAGLGAALATLAGIAGVAGWLGGGSAEESVRLGAWFAVGMAAGLLALAGIAWILLRVVRASLGRWRGRLPATVRHGLANLYRPGSQAPAVLVALGIGVMLMVTVHLVQHTVLGQLKESAPPGMPNVFLLNITQRERAAVTALVDAQPGVEAKLEIVPVVSAQLKSVNGVSLAKLKLEGWGRRFRGTRSVTWAVNKPEHTEILRGAWWSGPPAAPEVSVGFSAAEALGVEPGAVLEWEGFGRQVKARVAAVHRSESVRPGANIEFIFSPGALDGLPVSFFGAMRVAPRAVPALQRAAYERFPTLTVVNVADVLEILQEVVDQVALVVRFVSFFTLAAGAVILASAVAATRFQRVREVVILKALGATRRRVASMFSVEFLMLGAVAGWMGGLLASGFAGLLLDRLFNVALRLDPLPVLVAVAATALLANAAGWLAGYRILSQKPLEALRGE